MKQYLAILAIGATALTAAPAAAQTAKQERLAHVQQLVRSSDIVTPGIYRMVNADTGTLVYFTVAGNAGQITHLELVPFGLLPADAVERLKAAAAAQ